MDFNQCLENVNEKLKSCKNICKNNSQACFSILKDEICENISYDCQQDCNQLIKPILLQCYGKSSKLEKSINQKEEAKLKKQKCNLDESRCKLDCRRNQLKNETEQAEKTIDRNKYNKVIKSLTKYCIEECQKKKYECYYN